MSRRLFQLPDAKLVDAYYSDPLFYEFHHEDYVQDIDYYVDLASRHKRKGPILELGCGTGRLTIPMAHAGARIVGVDLNDGLLSHMKGKLDKPGNEAVKKRISLVQADILDLDIAEEFSLVLLPFNTLQHFHSMNEILTVLTRVKRHLKPNGRFVFDILHPELDYLADAGGRRGAKETIQHPHDGTPWYFQERHEYDAKRQINYAFHYYRKQGSDGRPVGAETVFVLKQRQYFPQEIDFLLQAAGYRIDRKFGDFERTPFEGHHDVQVFECLPENV